MNKELMEALSSLEREKGISKDTLFDAIENSLYTACKNHFGKADTDNVRVEIDRETGDFKVFADKTVVETAEEVPVTVETAGEVPVTETNGKEEKAHADGYDDHEDGCSQTFQLQLPDD